MAITLRYFTEFGKPVLQKTICGGIYDLPCDLPCVAPPADEPTSEASG